VRSPPSSCERLRWKASSGTLGSWFRFALNRSLCVGDLSRPGRVGGTEGRLRPTAVVGSVPEAAERVTIRGHRATLKFSGTSHRLPREDEPRIVQCVDRWEATP